MAWSLGTFFVSTSARSAWTMLSAQSTSSCTLIHSTGFARSSAMLSRRLRVSIGSRRMQGSSCGSW